METQVKKIAERLKGLRQMMEITPEEMARVTDVTLDEYLAKENGEQDFSFTFLFKCATRFGVDISAVVSGEEPHLQVYAMARKGEGMPIRRRREFDYQHLAYLFKDRLAEPFVVRAKSVSYTHLCRTSGRECERSEYSDLSQICAGFCNYIS